MYEKGGEPKVFLRKQKWKEQENVKDLDRTGLKADFVEASNGEWKNAYEIDAPDDPVPMGKWIWFDVASSSYGHHLFDERPFDAIISKKIEIPFSISHPAYGLFKIYDHDQIIKYARVVINDEVVLLKSNWKYKKEALVNIENLQAGTNFILIEIKMKKRYPLTKIILGTLKQPAISAQIEVYSNHNNEKSPIIILN